MTKELITEKNYLKIRRRLEELLVRAWKMSRPLCPKMNLDFKVSPVESYFSTTGQIYWRSPVWRGDAFATSILFHEQLHWVLYPLDIFRSLKELYEARRLLAEELHFKPEIIHRSLWVKEEDWSKFSYSIEEFQLVQNILADFLVHLHLHDNYPTVWEDLWNFLTIEGAFYLKEKALKRDTTFLLYLAVYPELIPDLPKIPVVEQASLEKIPKIAKLIRACRAGRISTTFTLKELTKLFHENIVKDLDEEEQEEEEESRIKCPKCNSDEGWVITEYLDEATGKWVKL